MKREKRIIVYVSKEELERIRVAAAKDGQKSMSIWLLKLALASLEK